MGINKPAASIYTTHSISAANEKAKLAGNQFEQPMETNQMDVHVCVLAQRFPYMFEQPHMGMMLPSEWVDIFTELCQVIDFGLNQDHRGFQWRSLQRELGVPHWCWRLDRHPYSNLRVRSIPSVKNFQYMVVKKDPYRNLRRTITAVVELAVREAIVSSISTEKYQGRESGLV